MCIHVDSCVTDCVLAALHLYDRFAPALGRSGSLPVLPPHISHLAGAVSFGLRRSVQALARSYAASAQRCGKTGVQRSQIRPYLTAIAAACSAGFVFDDVSRYAWQFLRAAVATTRDLITWRGIYLVQVDNVVVDNELASSPKLV